MAGEQGISIYICGICNQEAVVENPADGTIPGAIACPRERCDGLAAARFPKEGEEPTPTYRWHNPTARERGQLYGQEAKQMARTGAILVRI